MLLSIVPVFAFTLCILSCYTKVILNIDVPLPICLGSVAELTYITNGTSILGWRYKIFESYYDSPNQITHVPVLVGPFTTRLTYVQGSQFTSVATINVTANLNGIMLHCADNDFSLSNTEIESFKFSLNEATNITFLNVNAISSDQIYIYWSKSTCISRYTLSINEQYYNLQTNSMIYQHNTSNNTLRISVTGFDLSGNNINSVHKTYYFRRYEFTVIVEVVVNITGDHMTFAGVLIIIEPRGTEQPLLLSCLVTLTNKADPSKFEESDLDCTQSLKAKFDVTPGTIYVFQVIVTNIVGTTQVKGNLTIPVKPVQIIINDTVTSTITIIEYTPVPTISERTDTPYIIGIGVIATVLVVCVIIFTIIIIYMQIKIREYKRKELE